MHFNQEIYPSYNVTAQVLEVGNDVAVGLNICMLDKLVQILFSNAYMNHQIIYLKWEKEVQHLICY